MTRTQPARSTKCKRSRPTRPFASTGSLHASSNLHSVLRQPPVGHSMVYLLEGCWGPHHACQQTCQQAPPASRSVVVRQRGGPMHDLTGAFQLISTHKSPLWAVWTALLISATVHTLEGMSVSRAALALLFLVLTRASSGRRDARASLRSGVPHDSKGEELSGQRMRKADSPQTWST